MTVNRRILYCLNWAIEDQGDRVHSWLRIEKREREEMDESPEDREYFSREASFSARCRERHLYILQEAERWRGQWVAGTATKPAPSVLVQAVEGLFYSERSHLDRVHDFFHSLRRRSWPPSPETHRETEERLAGHREEVRAIVEWLETWGLGCPDSSYKRCM